MKLIKFTVEKFRSIVPRSSMNIFDKTVFIGPNNEGKSNILRALVTSLRILSAIANEPQMITREGKTLHYKRSLLGRLDPYNWTDDYPVGLQNTRGNLKNKRSIFTLDFELSEQEFQEFKTLTKTNLKHKVIPIKIETNDEDVRFTLNIPGHFYKKASEAKMIKIASFITSKINICYIDAFRTAGTALQSIGNLLDLKIQKVHQLPAYKNLLKEIQALYKPELDEMSEQVQNLLHNFIPNINQTQISLAETFIPQYFRRAPHQFKILINDGVSTELKQKGSGVQSLVALFLAQYVSTTSTRANDFILAVDEPESHLHSQAIHEVGAILTKISKNSQVIITTHSPLLVNTDNISANIIVSQNQAHTAADRKEIRQILGVKASDNLLQAENVLLVEGYSDERILKTILSEYSEKLNNAFADGSLTIMNSHGCRKILPLLKWIKSGFCKYHILFDNDAPGRQERLDLLNEGNAVESEITLLSCAGMKNSELEDCFDKTAYWDQLQKIFNITRDVKNILDNNNAKWSDRLKNLFTSQGQVWDENIEERVKTIVADCIVSRGKQAVLPYRESIIFSLVEKIENMLES